jgi:hypothetical protein
MRNQITCLALAALLCAPGLFGQSEEEFFSSGEVEAQQGAAEKVNLSEEIEKERVGLSGILQASGSYTLTRDLVRGEQDIGGNPFSSVMIGDFLVDVRLKRSFRAFVDLNLGYLATGTTLLGIKEIFVDFNLANTVYFRAGKQVLQWGTGYFWNPTDLINIERKSFLNLEGLREGVFGLRLDVTFAPWFHLYTFLDLNGVQDITTVAFAARAEFLAGRTEFGVSGWLNADQIPVFGADLSAPLFWGLNLTAEASLSWGDLKDKLDAAGAAYSIRDRLVPKIDVGLSRSFDAFDIQDRILVNAEFFYNDSGYDLNMFEVLSSPARATFLSAYYQAGYYGKYYGALFVTVNSFILTNMTLSLSGLANFSDLSAIAMAALSYAPVNNFTLTLQLGAYLGQDSREYTYGGGLLFATLGAKVAF